MKYSTAKVKCQVKDRAVLGNLAVTAFVQQICSDSKLCLYLPLASFIIACTQCTQGAQPLSLTYHTATTGFREVLVPRAHLPSCIPLYSQQCSVLDMAYITADASENLPITPINQSYPCRTRELSKTLHKSEFKYDK